MTFILLKNTENVPQFGFFWYFLMIRLRVYVFVRDPNEVLVRLSVIWEVRDVDMPRYQ